MDIDIRQGITGWEVSWTTAKNGKNTRYGKTFKTFEEASRFVEGELLA